MLHDTFERKVEEKMKLKKQMMTVMISDIWMRDHNSLIYSDVCLAKAKQWQKSILIAVG